MPFDGTLRDDRPAPIKDPILRLLVDGRALLERGWCQTSVCQDDHGNVVHLQHATHFCSYGALLKAASIVQNNPYVVANHPSIMKALCVLDDQTTSGIIGFNDRWGQRKENVLKVWDRAIAKRRAGKLGIFGRMKSLLC